MIPIKIATAKAVVKGASLIIIVAIALLSSAAVFSYRFFEASLRIAPPVVWFEDPNTPGVRVMLYDEKTRAEIVVNHTYRLERIRRSAIFYDTFDDNPFPTRLTNLTCAWRWNATYGTVQIAAGSRGPSNWYYECVALANVDISGYVSQGKKIYIASIVWKTPFSRKTYIRADTVYADKDKPGDFYRIGYRASIYGDDPGDGDDDNVRRIYSSIYARDDKIEEKQVSERNTLEDYYVSQIASMINFATWRAEHWNVTLLSYDTIPSSHRFYPDRAGIGYWTKYRDVIGFVHYDNLVISVDSPPWFVNVTGLPDGWRARIVARDGRIVSQATSSGGLAVLPVWAPEVYIGMAGYNPNKDYGFVFKNAYIEVLDGAGNLVTRGLFDYVVGGDVYAFTSPSFGRPYPEPILLIMSNMSIPLYARMEVLSVACSPLSRANATIYLVSWSGAAAPLSIVIQNGALLQATTGDIYIGPPQSWSGSWEVGALRLSSSISKGATCVIDSKVIWRVSSGAHCEMPVKIELRS